MSFELDTIVCGDCLDVMAAMSADSVNLIIADPPYGISYRSSRKTGRNGKPRKNMPDFGEDVFNPDWIVEASRVLKQGGAFYMFTRWDVLHLWKTELEHCGLSVSQRIVWNKTHWGMGDLRYYGSQTEDILFIRKGDHQLRWTKRAGNIWSANTLILPEGQYDHPTQKPESIVSKMISLSSDKGDVIADFHMGSGTTAVAALKLGRHFYGCDINPDYVKMANERIEKTRLALSQMELAL